MGDFLDWYGRALLLNGALMRAITSVRTSISAGTIFSR